AAPPTPSSTQASESPGDSPSPTSPPIAIIGSTGGPSIGSGFVDGTIRPGGPGVPLLPLLLVTLVALSGAAGLFFVALRRRRRDDVTVIVEAPAALALTAGDDPYSETHLPRWRRPSLQAARRRSERGEVEPTWQLAFREPTLGAERRRVRYRLVRLSDAPDEIRSAEIGQLEANDEVEVLDRYAGFIRVRTPIGTEGWVHRTTLGLRIGEDGEEIPD